MVARNFHFRKKTVDSSHSVFFWFAFFVVVVGVVGFLAVQNIKIYQKRNELSEKANQLESKINDLQQQNIRDAASIQTDQSASYQEKVLREQGLYKKPGEQVITVLPPANSQQQSQKLQQEKVWWNPDTWFR